MEVIQSISDLKISEECAAIASTGARVLLDALPTEVLLPIWVNLDEPGPLAQTNKRFRALSKDVLWRAKWFMQRYDRYLVIYHAIFRSKIFGKELLEQLLRLGAPLSRYLAQILAHVRGQGEDTHIMLRLDEKILWGTNISDAAYDATCEQAVRMHGEISYSLADCDGFVFHQWLREQYLESSAAYDGGRVCKPVPSEAVRLAFKSFDFMPLPLGFQAAGNNGHQASVKLAAGMAELGAALGFDPELTDVALAQGCKLSNSQVENLVSSWSSQFGVKRTKELVEKLKVDGMINYSQKNAHVLMVCIACDSGLNRVQQVSQVAEYEVLKHLWSTRSLSFNLADMSWEVHCLFRDIPRLRYDLV